MLPPSWNDADIKIGSMIRGGLWLVQHVGEGNTFTKEELRQAFPGISQIDRRLRDLRDFGWVILTNTEDATLMSEDQRFVKAGVPVWDPVARREAALKKPISAKERLAVLDRDHHMCTVCGICGGESYTDNSLQTAVLSVVRRNATRIDGEEETHMVTECKRCSAGSVGQSATANDVLSAIDALDPSDRQRLARWMARGRRGSTPIERAWSSYRQLPPDLQESIHSNFPAE